MKTILATAYAINPYKGSEDGMGWNFTNQIARYNKVVVVTRKNNRDAIEKYMVERPKAEYENMAFLYYDLPYFLRFWKRGSRGALLYYYLWQLCMPLFVRSKSIDFDLTHNLNFHNDWTPSMLWTLGKPMVWGPVGHHPKIPTQFLLDTFGRKAWMIDRCKWLAKKFFWSLDPLLGLTARKADFVFCMNSSVQQVLDLKPEKTALMPSVASEDIAFESTEKNGFNVLSVGRFIPLKGFDLTIDAFAKYYHRCSGDQQAELSLTLVGSGPLKQQLQARCEENFIAHCVTIIDWIPRADLMNLYREASVFLFPSHEGAGMVVSEAISYGLPTLCLDNEGPGEFITPNCGRAARGISRTETVDQLADFLAELHADPSLCKELQEGARQRFKSHFAWNNRGEQLKKTYQQVLSKEALHAEGPVMRCVHSTLNL